ncbi:hypothetical protein FH969_03065 [Miniimonas arenae]|uniref:Uncharacterized protein n=1 Tax=Miniimonas arenae TaxID=676201 RepID=A0A5C5BGF6_9MICO|nr:MULTISPECIES: hypothetical protein [Miniimonas]TNU76526.1 hypothetical protein FH969_03065 [Miniimonas arenae]
MPSDWVEELVTLLYRVDPEDFVTERARYAAQVRAAGDEVGAARLRRLPKPTIAASWVNRLAVHWPEELEQLLAVGESLREATSTRDRSRLAALDRERRTRTDALVSLLWHLGEEEAAAGRRGPSPESLARVVEMLTAAVMDPEVAEQVRRGQVARTVVHEGFGVVGPDDGVPAPTVRHLRPGADQVARATADLVDAENRLTAATDTVGSLESMVTSLDAEIAALEHDRDAARENLATWQRTRTEAERAVRTARQRLDALTDEP